MRTPNDFGDRRCASCNGSGIVAAGAGTGLTPEEAKATLVALHFGMPDEEPGRPAWDILAAARSKLRAIAAMRSRVCPGCGKHGLAGDRCGCGEGGRISPDAPGVAG